MKTNWCLMLVRNNKVLTQEAIDSVLAQTVPTRILAIDNGSTDGSAEMLATYDHEQVITIHYAPGKGVAESWNVGLRYIWEQGAEHALVVNNDVLLRPDTYELLLADGGQFVTGVGVRGMHYGGKHDGAKVFKDNLGKEVFPGGAPGPNKRPHPDFSNYLIRKSVWDAVGEFDEGFRGAMAEDCDYHVRMHKAGVDAYSLDLPFYHYGSATIKHSADRESRMISDQAGINRSYFKQKWGCELGSTEYYHGIFGHDAPGDAPPMI